MRKYTLLIVLIGIALSLRLYHLDTRGLITDEKFTLVTSNGFWVGGANQSAFKKEFFTPADFWEKKCIQDYFDATAHADFGTHIIHNGVMHYWMKLFGNSDYSVRFPSVIFNLLTIIIVFLMVLKYFKNYWMAFLAGLFLAVDPLNIAQSHIARSYPLSFLLILLSTEYFIRIVRGENSRKNFVIYTVLVGMSLLNHYINFFIPLAHGLVFLALRNKSHLWKGFIIAAIVNAGLLFYWFNWGGGYTAMGFLKDKNELHKKIAEDSNDELSLTIQKATPDLIAKKAIQLYYDIGIIGHGLFDRVKGVKVFLASFIVFTLLLVAFKNSNKAWVKYSALLLTVLLLFYQRDYLAGILVSAALFLAVYYGTIALKKSYLLEENKGQFVLLVIGLFMLVVPILFVVNDAYSSGNTTSLTHRYIGNAAPFVAIFMAVGIVSAAQRSFWFGALFVFVFFVQFQSVKKGITDYFADRSVYNAYFIPERVKNPYISAARKVEALAVSGDTLVIPGAYKDKYQERFAHDMQISYKDAQFLNLYFDRDFKILQTVDPNEREKLFLKKVDGTKLLIFDFKGEEFRY